MKYMSPLFRGIRNLRERLEETLIRALFNSFYDSHNCVASSRMVGRDYNLPSERKPLATRFLDRDYLLGALKKRA